MEKSDYLVNYFDVAIQELMKPVKQISKEKLQTLLTFCSYSGDSTLESFKDQISVHFDSMSFFEKLLKINSVAGMDVDRYMQEVRSGTFTFASQSSSSLGGMVSAEPVALIGNQFDLACVFKNFMIRNGSIYIGYFCGFSTFFNCQQKSGYKISTLIQTIIPMQIH